MHWNEQKKTVRLLQISLDPVIVCQYLISDCRVLKEKVCQRGCRTLCGG
jgi:hypothetical protein